MNLASRAFRGRSRHGSRCPCSRLRGVLVPGHFERSKRCADRVQDRRYDPDCLLVRTRASTAAEMRPERLRTMSVIAAQRGVNSGAAPRCHGSRAARQGPQQRRFAGRAHISRYSTDVRKRALIARHEPEVPVAPETSPNELPRCRKDCQSQSGGAWNVQADGDPDSSKGRRAHKREVGPTLTPMQRS